MDYFYPAQPEPTPSYSIIEDIARRVKFELDNAPSYIPESVHVWFRSVFPHPLVEIVFISAVGLLTLAWTLGVFTYVSRHVAWLKDTLWAAPCIAIPETMDRWYTAKFLERFEQEPLQSADKSKRTLGIVLTMGAQNAGCHLVYWTLLDELRRRLNAEGYNVVYEINRWCRDGPMTHADLAMSPACFPPEQLHHLPIRRLVGDYIGVPILHLNSALATKSLDASVARLESRLTAAGLYTTASVSLLCHSLGGPVAYRYLQRRPNSNVAKIVSFGSMNHYTNSKNGLNGDKDAEPYFPVRVPHLDILSGWDFLSFPFYAPPGSGRPSSPPSSPGKLWQGGEQASSEANERSLLPAPSDHRRTAWTTEDWSPLVFGHTTYAQSESFYEEVLDFFLN